ncbi:MAG: hypothetical protein LBS05_09455 [Tannerellaceae bacterium]|jgi:hypothetical protein|nr:hypothetical protein [Tannerellaceae bacterium]
MISEFARLIDIPKEELLGKRRSQRLDNARQLLWKKMRQNGYTVTWIAELFHRTHSSVSKGIQRSQFLLETGDRLVTYWNQKTESLTLDSIDMSERKEIIEIRTPRYITRVRQMETYTFRGFSCPCCSGRGYTSVEIGKDEWRDDACAICGGTGALEADVIIQWVAKNDDRDKNNAPEVSRI